MNLTPGEHEKMLYQAWLTARAVARVHVAYRNRGKPNSIASPSFETQMKSYELWKREADETYEGLQDFQKFKESYGCL